MNNDVHEAFTTYKMAILNDDGNRAFSVVDKRTRDYYDELHRLSVSGSETEIRGLSLMDMMQVVLMRHRIPSEEFLSMTGEKLFVYCVDKGWVGKNSVANLEIGDIEIHENFAIGSVINNGQLTKMQFHFYHEEDSWKIDITKTVEYGAAAFKQLQEGSGTSEEEFIFSLVESASGTKVNPGTIFKPLDS